MKKVTARKYLLVLSMLFTLLIVLIPGCTPAQKPVPGFHPKLSISEPPVLGKPVKLTLTFDSPVPEGLEETELDYRAQISLLPGCYDVIEGDVEQIGKIIAGKVNSLEITIKSLRTGSADISAYVILLLPSGDTWGDWENDYLYIQIYDDHTDVSEKTDNKYYTNRNNHYIHDHYQHD